MKEDSEYVFLSYRKCEEQILSKVHSFAVLQCKWAQLRLELRWVRGWKVKEYTTQVELDEMISTAIEAYLNFSNFCCSLIYLCDLYKKT